MPHSNPPPQSLQSTGGWGASVAAGVAEGTAALGPLAAAGEAGAARNDGRGTLEPHAVASSVATSASTATLEPKPAPRADDRTCGLYAIMIGRDDAAEATRAAHALSRALWEARLRGVSPA